MTRTADYGIANAYRAEDGELIAPTEQCPFCLDEAYVFLGWSKVGTDQFAPCPRCQRGYRAEFAVWIQRNSRSGKYEERQNPKPPWGLEGFWRGDSVSGVTPVNRSDVPLSKEENALRMRLLMARHTQVSAGQTEGLADPCVGLTVKNREERMRQLRQAVKVQGLA
jgi:hypothetical protein